jgi:hypothetical protein
MAKIGMAKTDGHTGSLARAHQPNFNGCSVLVGVFAGAGVGLQAGATRQRSCERVWERGLGR